MTKINDVYDIGAAFEAVENELITSMIRNMKRHKVEEANEDMQWEQWQVLQLRALEKYKQKNRKKYGKQFRYINAKIEALIQAARSEGGMDQEEAILRAIKKGFPAEKVSRGGTAEFFKLNDRKLEALVKATADDMEKAETAVLRRAIDQYRKVIYNAQVYANTGAGTYEKAVDMATKDFLSAGLNCVVYANGARHTLADYADMAIRTASKRAYLQGEGMKRQEWGLHLVIMNKRGCPCPKCLPFVGKIMIDDVWSGGSRKDGPYPLMSEAIEAGLYHPRCKDSHTTYFPGITTVDPKYNPDEIRNLEEQARQEARQQYAERQEKKFGRMAEFSLDPENQKRYAAKKEEWKNVAKSIRSDIIEAEGKKEVSDVHTVGKIDKEIYKCITDDIVTDEVILTENQIQHILERHPDAYEKALSVMKETIENPDYIIADDKHKNTGLVIKNIVSEQENLQLVLRICTSEDIPGYKNSVISCWKISDKRLQNYLRNKQILYKKE